MRKAIRMMMLLAMMMAASVSMGSCSSDDADGPFSEKRVGNYIMGYKWYLDNSRSELRFYRNRLVTCMSRSGKITSGMLAYAESNFFGMVDNGILDGRNSRPIYHDCREKW